MRRLSVYFFYCSPSVSLHKWAEYMPVFSSYNFMTAKVYEFLKFCGYSPKNSLTFGQ